MYIMTHTGRVRLCLLVATSLFPEAQRIPLEGTTAWDFQLKHQPGS